MREGAAFKECDLGTHGAKDGDEARRQELLLAAGMTSVKRIAIARAHATAAREVRPLMTWAFACWQSCFLNIP